MICPLDLTERQTIIYKKLCEKCNFQDMTVKYTTMQLSADIKSIDIDRYIINREIKTMVKKGYLEVIYQGKKGKPSIYKIVKINEINYTLSSPYVHINCTLKPSDSKGLEDMSSPNVHTKYTLSAHPINETEKEKDINNNIYRSINSDIEEIWSKYPEKKGKEKAAKEIKKILKTISKEELIRAVNRYTEGVKKERSNGFNKCYQYGSTFFKSGYIDYLDSNSNETYLEPSEQEPNEWTTLSEEEVFNKIFGN